MIILRGTSKQEQLEKRLYEAAQIFIETKKNLEGLISEFKSSKQELSKVVRMNLERSYMMY